MIEVYNYLKADKQVKVKNFWQGIVGFVLLGFATSVSELVSTVSATVFLNNPQVMNRKHNRQQQWKYAYHFSIFNFTEKTTV